MIKDEIWKVHSTLTSVTCWLWTGDISLVRVWQFQYVSPQCPLVVIFSAQWKATAAVIHCRNGDFLFYTLPLLWLTMFWKLLWHQIYVSPWRIKLPLRTQTLHKSFRALPKHDSLSSVLLCVVWIWWLDFLILHSEFQVSSSFKHMNLKNYIQ